MPYIAVYVCTHWRVRWRAQVAVPLKFALDVRTFVACGPGCRGSRCTGGFASRSRPLLSSALRVWSAGKIRPADRKLIHLSSSTMGPACRKRSHDQRDRYLSRWTPFIPRFVTSPRNQFRHFCVHLSLNIRIIFWIKLAHAFFYRSRVGLLGFAVNRVTWWSCTQKTLLRSFKELSNDVLEQQNGPKMSQIFAF